MDLKAQYAQNHAKINKQSLYLNERLFKTYNRISKKLLNSNLSGSNIDLGCGDKGFTSYCESIQIHSFPYDYPLFNIEKDSLPHANNSIDFVSLNAVIEHIKEPDHIFIEIMRVLKNSGLIFIRTPNWQMDYKNFYNDPTHVRPYAPATLKKTLELYGFDCIFIEPGLIEKSWFWWRLPNSIKWSVCSWLKNGTKSLLAVAKKR